MLTKIPFRLLNDKKVLPNYPMDHYVTYVIFQPSYRLSGYSDERLKCLSGKNAQYGIKAGESFLPNGMEIG